MSTSYNPRYEDTFPWCAPDPKDSKMAMCKWCCKSIKIESMGRVALLSHEKAKGHQHKVLLQKSNLQITHFSSNVASSSVQEPQSTDPTSNIQASAPIALTNKDEKGSSDESNVMKRYFLKEQVTKTEILWAFETISTHNSYRSAGANVTLFKIMFPDSQIASKLEMSRTKVSYLITHGLAPYYLNEVFNALDACSELVVGFDETLNKISQRQQMDISVRYWNDAKQKVDCRYIGSAFLSSSRAVDLLKGLKGCVERNPTLLSKVIQLSMDGPNVNWRLLKDFSEEMKQLRAEPSFDFLNIGSCGLHAVHNAFKDGMKKTEWNIDEFLVSLYHLFKDFPLRRADYKESTGSDLFPVKFCPVRWIENVSVAERAAKMVPYLKKYVKAVRSQHDKKLKESNTAFKRSFPAVLKSRTFGVVENAITDTMVSAKLAFFISSAAAVEPFLREFQCDAPMAPFLFEELTAVVRSVMGKVLKPDCLNIKGKSLVDIELSDGNTLPTSQVDIGFGVKAAIKAANDREKIGEKSVLQFRSGCKAYYLAFLKKLVDRSPLTYSFTRYISCVNPELMSNSPAVSIKRLDFCLDYMVQRHQVAGTVADKTREEYSRLLSMPSIKSSLASYRRSEQRLDVFWVDLLNGSGKDFPNLFVFLKKILVLSHGNATLERGFSVNKECLVVNLIEESLVAQRIVHDAIQDAGGVNQVALTESLIQYARNAHGRYVDLLKLKKQEKSQQDDEAQRKRAASQAIKELEMKKAKLMAEAQKEAALLDEQMRDLLK